MQIQLHNYKDTNGGCRMSMTYENAAEVHQIEYLFNQAEKLGLKVYRYANDLHGEGIGFILADKE
jgi:hypothetical protein